MSTQCTHLNQIKIKTTTVHVCEECVKTGDTWVHLRLCLICGHVGCCDSSKNKHATKHFHKTEHPLIRSIEPGEAWIWCYVDEIEPGELVAWRNGGLSIRDTPGASVGSWYDALCVRCDAWLLGQTQDADRPAIKIDLTRSRRSCGGRTLESTQGERRLCLAVGCLTGVIFKGSARIVGAYNQPRNALGSDG